MASCRRVAMSKYHIYDADICGREEEGDPGPQNLDQTVAEKLTTYFTGF